MTSTAPATASARERVRVRRRGKKNQPVEDDSRPAGWMPIALAALTLLAPTLGGSVTLWAQATLALAVGSLLIFSQAARRLGCILPALAVALVMLALAPLLPVQFFAHPVWRGVLENIRALPLPPSISPQPWLTLEATGLILVGITFALLVFSHEWTEAGRALALRIYAGGITALALVSLFLVCFHWRLPFWSDVGNSPINFGFFPNRNQTANVLALGGIIISALGSYDLRRGEKTAWLWFAALGLICVALIVAYSRAGIVLLFAGVTISAGISITRSGSAKISAILVASIFLLLTLLFLFGGSTLERFHSAPGLAKVAESDFRLALYRDSVRLANEAPLLGHGLGNFEPLFARARDFSDSPNRPVHPESDWLWMAIEMGWLGPALLVAALAIWAIRFFPLTGTLAPELRIAAAVAVLCFALHGMVDVSGHRLGSLWPALFLAGAALAPTTEGPDLSPAPPWRRLALRLPAVACLVMGGLWFASYRQDLPTTATLNRLTAQVEYAPWESAPGETIRRTTAALQIAPLDWNLYFQRSLARALAGETYTALDDLRVARALEPNWPDFCYTAGLLWLKLEEPELALASWREVVTHPGEETAQYYRQMLSAVKGRASIREALRGWARDDRALLLAFLGESTPFEFALEASALLEKDPTLRSLSFKERSDFLHLWAERQPDDFAAAAEKKPDWLNEAWSLAASHHAGHGQFQEAMELIQRMAPAPSIPRVSAQRPLSDLEREFYLAPTDLLKGLAACEAQRKAGQLADALQTVQKLQNVARPPSYLWAIESDLNSERGSWEPAWDAWSRYEDKRRHDVTLSRQSDPGGVRKLSMETIWEDDEEPHDKDLEFTAH